ncbi:hypothetical protein G7K_1324-t2 [Saitoella complicata NRRL Y-17804]|uniref:Uncharacterized protein n=1 Tax=Saitoella complicata (strain BCRC 22490 / CBS 7301 / JCM 7358 / NBRC 10748 / NRRL Y-17804) TaxID=698492 RepID=A0A0E9NBD2_SAICN|nr:hypothetical protein G7K_1324-t2 [Saitoella complicata NRRL Y-17804]
MGTAAARSGYQRYTTPSHPHNTVLHDDLSPIPAMSTSTLLALESRSCQLLTAPRCRLHMYRAALLLWLHHVQRWYTTTMAYHKFALLNEVFLRSFERVHHGLLDYYPIGLAISKAGLAVTQRRSHQGKGTGLELREPWFKTRYPLSPALSGYGSRFPFHRLRDRVFLLEDVIPNWVLKGSDKGD